MLRKSLALCLVLLLSLSLLFVACDNKQKETEKVDSESSATPAGELKVQVEEAWLPHYEAAATRVKEKYPEVKINFITVGSFDHLETLDATDVMNKDIADLYAYPLDRLTSLMDKEALAGFNAAELAKQIGGFSDFNAGIGQALKVDDKYFGIPYNIETLVIFANKANAEAEGIDLSQPLELAAVTKPETALLPIFDAWFGVALTNSANIELLGKNEDGSLFSDFAKPWAELSPEHQAFVTTIYNYWKLNADANTALFDKDAGWAYVDDNFRSGNAGVVRLGGPWEINPLKELSNNGADLEIYPISALTVNGQPLRHWQGGWALGINSRCEADPAQLMLAEVMMAELINPEYAIDLFKATGKILENASPETYANSDLDEIDKKTIDAVIKSYKEAQNRPLFREWSDVWTSYKNAILSWNAVKPESPEAAYTEIQKSFEALLAQH